MTKDEGFPGGSRSRVNRAGDRVRRDSATPEDLDVIDQWRAAHRSVLNTFQAILRGRTRGTEITVAQRHKRRTTIFGKLKRIPGMELARMDDVAGCRLIFNSLRELYSFRENLHAARFNHRLRNDTDKYDYIKSPKSTGYRGVHDIYVYDVNSTVGRSLKGLLVEIQYRTLVQHAWATAVEVIGFISQSQPKFQQGDTRYVEAMALASELLARKYENSRSARPDVGDADLVEQFLKADAELGLMTMLRGLDTAHSEITINRNAILIFGESGDLEVKTYRDATTALRALFELEKQQDARDIVLVRADTSDEVRLAFRNYFSDAREFIRLLDDACESLSGRRSISTAPARRRKKRPIRKVARR